MGNVQLQISKPKLNSQDGRYYQRYRWIYEGNGKIVISSERIQSSKEIGQLLDPSDANQVRMMRDDFFAAIQDGIGVELTPVPRVRLDPFAFGVGVATTLKNQLDWDIHGDIPTQYKIPYAAWPGTDSPWDKSTLYSDPSPRFMDPKGSASWRDMSYQVPSGDAPAPSGIADPNRRAGADALSRYRSPSFNGPSPAPDVPSRLDFAKGVTADGTPMAPSEMMRPRHDSETRHFASSRMTTKLVKPGAPSIQRPRPEVPDALPFAPAPQR